MLSIASIYLSIGSIYGYLSALSVGLGTATCKLELIEAGFLSRHSSVFVSWLSSKTSPILRDVLNFPEVDNIKNVKNVVRDCLLRCVRCWVQSWRFARARFVSARSVCSTPPPALKLLAVCHEKVMSSFIQSAACLSGLNHLPAKLMIWCNIWIDVKLLLSQEISFVLSTS